MSISGFWNSSLVDIQDFIESYTRRKKEEIMKNFTHAEIMANRLAMLLPSDDKVQRIMPWDYYPELFKEERIRYKKQKEEQEFKEFKMNRRNAMDAYNAKYYGGGETNGK